MVFLRVHQEKPMVFLKKSMVFLGFSQGFIKKNHCFSSKNQWFSQGFIRKNQWFSQKNQWFSLVFPKGFIRKNQWFSQKNQWFSLVFPKAKVQFSSLRVRPSRPSPATFESKFQTSIRKSGTSTFEGFSANFPLYGRRLKKALKSTIRGLKVSIESWI